MNESCIDHILSKGHRFGLCQYIPIPMIASR